MVANDNNPNDHRYMVDEDDVQSHAPAVFDCLREYYDRLSNLSKVLVEPGPIAERLQGIITIQGVLPGEGVTYENGLLVNDHFRISVVFHLCLSTWIGHVLSWEEYIILLDILENAVLEDERNRPESISPQSTILKMFDVSPSILPKAFLQKVQVVDEFSMATSIIYEEVTKTRPVSDGFESFAEYYEYMQKFVIEITKKLNEQGMYSTHELDRFTLLMIAARNGLPRFDVPYVMAGHVQQVPTAAIRHMVTRVIFHISGLNPGDDTEDGSMIEGDDES